MSLFWDNAAKLMEAAVEAAGKGFSTTESMTVLIGPQGGIHLLADNDWPLDRVASERGARMAYRIERSKERVELNGVEGSTVCHLEAELPNATAKRLLLDRPRYTV